LNEVEENDGIFLHGERRRRIERKRALKERKEGG